MDEPQTASARLRAYRVAHGQSLLELARIVECDPSMLSKIETGSRSPGRRMKKRLQECCGIAQDSWPRRERRSASQTSAVG